MIGRKQSLRWGLLSIAVALISPTATTAQAVCSAPHSSPTLVQSGTISTLPAGAGWLQVTLYRQRADESFNHLGNRQPFLADGQFDTRSVFLTGSFGLGRGLELWAQLPVHNLSLKLRVKRIPAPGWVMSA